MSADDNLIAANARSAGAGADDHQLVFASIRLRNLKSFLGAHEVPLAPLTLVFGPNSAGKSSLLGSVKYLCEWWKALATTSEEPGADALLRNFRLISDARDLVSFGDRERTLTIGLTLGPTNLLDSGGTVQADLLVAEESSSVTLRVHFGVPGEEPVCLEELVAAMPTLELEIPRSGSHGALNSSLLAAAAKVMYLGPHRGDPERLGRQLAAWMVSRPAAGKVVNDRFRRLDVPYAMRPATYRDVNPAIGEYLQTLHRTPEGADESVPRPDDIEALLLTDTRTGARVRLEEVGYGVGQVLPIVLACADTTPHVLLIEQPELHLHPRLQSDVGELLVDAVQGGSQVIAETHSENVLLRVQRLVKQRRLSPEQVCVLYIDNTPQEGASVRRLRLGTDGDLLDPWPTGFFDDRLDDILGILE